MSAGASTRFEAPRHSWPASARAWSAIPAPSDARTSARKTARRLVFPNPEHIPIPSRKLPGDSLERESRRASPKTASSVNHSLRRTAGSGSDVKKGGREGPPRGAIVGRANVGKSTLFNRLLRASRALVEDRPGVTRDRVAVTTEIEGRNVLLVDTGGLDPEAEAGIPAAIRRQVGLVLED